MVISLISIFLFKSIILSTLVIIVGILFILKAFGLSIPIATLVGLEIALIVLSIFICTRVSMIGILLTLGNTIVMLVDDYLYMTIEEEI